MTSHSWLESSLHRSSKLGREVLERARKRSVRWSNTSPYGSRTSLESTGDIHQLDVKKIQEDPVNLHKSLDNAFDRVVEFMDHTSYECKNFYKSVPDPSDDDREHICRFHSGRPARPSPPPPSTCGRKRSPVPVKDSVKSQCGPEDFHIVLSPGSYAITAGVPGASPQTQVVRVNPGESMSLTFNI
ncbi:A-kinase-interacting protein 1 isoform X2 [Clupea harengus]|uniref:A-kinase-interacting protein 1 isoform X2 n=1 Tax=Clupea harengus TaxID=7950 RepID=A0A8M1KHD1_CLUHA|nr:A-kinase-interacting protein 1 isoform X2 [Clupea harengus]